MLVVGGETSPLPPPLEIPDCLTSFHKISLHPMLLVTVFGENTSNYAIIGGKQKVHQTMQHFVQIFASRYLRASEMKGERLLIANKHFASIKHSLSIRDLTETTHNYNGHFGATLCVLSCKKNI